MKKILIALALASLVATNADADGRVGYGHHGHNHGGGHYFWWGAALGAALTFPFYYSRYWENPGPYYYSPYYGPGPTVYVNPPVYVQRPQSYVVPETQPKTVVTQSPSSGVIELGPVSALPPASSYVAPSPDSDQGPSGQSFVYPSKGQSPQQQANDRYECNRWAINESGYDPDLRTHRNPETGPVAYGRALSACLDGRGYAVR